MYDQTETDETRTATSAERPRRPDTSTSSGRQRANGANGPRRAPWLYRLVRDRSGQSTTIGVALMLAVAAIGVTAIVALGGSALTSTQTTADLQRTEHAMTLLDSRGAMAALGESDSQRVRLSGTNDGNYEVNQDSGWIRVTHRNFTGTQNEEIFNRSLGSVDYTRGDTVIAYEGGGVWRTQDNGTVMVSPPEFHYRDQTLTMPLVRVVGSGAASGSVGAEVTPLDTGTEVTRIFPNRTTNTANGPGAPYDNGANSQYDNPVRNGTVVITVHSEHYKGWATYFAERTEGQLSVNHDRKTASIELRTLSGAPGEFAMPLVGDSLEIPSVAQQHNLTEFELTLAPDSSNANAFQQLQWSLYHQGPNGQQFEIHFTGNGRCQGSPPEYNDDIGVSVYYRHNNSAPSEEWERSGIDPTTNSHVSVDCSSGAPILTVDLFSTLDMTYKDIDIEGSDNKWHYGNVIKAQDAPSTLEVNQHTADAGHGPYTKGSSTEDLSFVMNHYFSRLGPDFELTVDAGPGTSQNRVDEGGSSGVLDYDTIDGEEFIQFLHITENRVRVELEG